jgi:hypothetical protein
MLHAPRARCTSVVNLGRSFTARLYDVSSGGLRMRAGQREAAWARAGEVLWIALDLPDEVETIEFVARMLHARPCATDEAVLLGCRFCPRDDSTVHDRQLARLRASLVQPARGPEGGFGCS